MAQEATRQHLVHDLSWRALLKVLFTAAVVWCMLQLGQVLAIIAVAVLLAVALAPAAGWLERRKLPRWAAATIPWVGLLAVIGLLFWFTWSSLADQARVVGQALGRFISDLAERFPPSLARTLRSKAEEPASWIASYSLTLAQSALSATTIVVLALVLAFYLLLDGLRVFAWVLAFVPRSQREKVARTVEEGRDVMMAYIVGNTVTSIIATIVSFIGLWILGVPAALFLAVIAGLSDFVPVIGFVLSAVPAVLLGLTVSPTTALLVVVLYVAYNTFETYVLSPWAYGGRMKLSSFAVVLAFAVGAELAGVIGAVLALPLAAFYPSIERIWLHEQLPKETVREHRELEDGTS